MNQEDTESPLIKGRSDYMLSSISQEIMDQKKKNVQVNRNTIAHFSLQNQ